MTPVVLGHEFCGTVVEAGELVRGSHQLRSFELAQFCEIAPHMIVMKPQDGDSDFAHTLGATLRFLAGFVTEKKEYSTQNPDVGFARGSIVRYKRAGEQGHHFPSGFWYETS